MVTTHYKTIKSYAFPILLITSIMFGGLVGFLLGPKAQYLKPFGELFLNLIFTAIVPLIFFSVSSAIAQISSLAKLGRIVSYMFLVFLLTGILASLYALMIVKWFPPAQDVHLSLSMPKEITRLSLSNQLVEMFTVSDFSKLLSHEHILALILFSIIIGLAVATTNGTKAHFVTFLRSGEELFMRVFSFIMYYAPIGFFAYFAVLVSELGPQLMESYARIALIYYASGIFYFLVVFTVFAYLAEQIKGVKLFWSNVFLPMITALATCSSAASIPANLLATKKIGIADEICETTVPLGAIIHKDGSVIGGIFKIAFLFGIFNLPFTGTNIILTALGVSLLVGTVMGAIPSGGMLGELLILSVYGFPPSSLIAIAAISIIIDPIATMLNVTGNTVGSMLIARFVEGKKWFGLKNKDQPKVPE